MKSVNPSAPRASLRDELRRRVLLRTHRRVRDLTIEWEGETVVLRGRASTYYAKQLAQVGVRDLLPGVSVRNAIEVTVRS